MLARHTGQKLPAQVKIFVHEEDANTLHLTVPLAPASLNELSDEDLERVAGGTDVGVTLLTILGTSMIASAGVSAATVAATKYGW